MPRYLPHVISLDLEEALGRSRRCPHGETARSAGLGTPDPKAEVREQTIDRSDGMLLVHQKLHFLPCELIKNGANFRTDDLAEFEDQGFQVFHGIDNSGVTLDLQASDRGNYGGQTPQGTVLANAVRRIGNVRNCLFAGFYEFVRYGLLRLQGGMRQGSNSTIKTI